MIKTIIFDLGGVYFTDGTKIAIENISKRFGLPKEGVKKILKGDLADKYRKEKITSEEFWSKAREQWGLDIPTKELSMLWIDAYKPMGGTISIIEGLKEAGYELLFLSDNAKERAEYLESRYHFMHMFRDGLMSYQVRLRKRDGRKIFELILSKASHSAEECLFIDDKEDYVKTARRVGMEALLFQNPEELESELKGLGLRF